MFIVIDIDEEYYEIIKNDVKNGMDYLPCKLIANGTPLPKEMTIKEAINELKFMPINYPLTNGRYDRATRLMQARDMAINALDTVQKLYGISAFSILDTYKEQEE